MRRLVVTVVVLILVVIAVDRIAWFLAEREIAHRIEASGQVGGSPQVKVGGFPFLTQVAAGKYTDVSVTADKVAVQQGLVVDQVSGDAQGIHIAASDIASQKKVPVPVDHIHTEGYVSFASLNAAAKSQLNSAFDVQLSRAADGKVAVTGEVKGLLGSAKVKGEANARIVDGKMVIDLTPNSMNLPPGISLQLGNLLGISYPVPPMPFGLKPEKLQVETGGIAFSATATNSVIDPNTFSQ